MADGRVEISVNLDNKEAEKQLRDLRRSIEKTAKDIESTGGKKAAITEQLEQARKAAKETAEEIKTLNAERLETRSSIAGMEENGEKGSDDYLAAKQVLKEQNYQLKEQFKLRDRYATRITDLEEKERNLTSQLEQQTASLEQQKASAGEVERVIASQASSSMPQLAASAEAVSKSMQKGFRNILKWGFGIRSAFILIRRLRSAVVEGVKAFAEQDEETRSNINGLKASLATLKASWGAAFAPVFNAVVPILQKLISWLTTAANAIAMFFSALTGKSTYKRAIKGQESLASSIGGTGDAAEKAEKQVLGFDEITKLNSENSNAGGGSTGDAGNIAQQFEEVPILETFKKHLDDILIIVGLIGAALLAWKLAPLLGISFTKMFGILTAIIGLVEMVHGGLDAWNNGVNWENFFDTLKGAALLVGGLALAFGTTGAAIGLLIAGIGMLVVGLHDWITTGELSAETFTMLEVGILAVGGAIALLTGSWIPLVVAAVAGLVLAVVKNWDEIWGKTKEAFNSIKEGWNTFYTNLIDSFSEFGTAAKKSFSDTLENMKKAASKALESITDVISEFRSRLSEAQESYVKSMDETFTKIREAYDKHGGGIKGATVALFEGAKGTFKAGYDFLNTLTNNRLEQFRQSFVEKFNAIRDKASEVVQKVKEFFNFKWEIPHIRLPHITVSWTDTSRSSIAKLLGITAIPRFSLQWYARGGIVDGTTIFGAGEAGKEAVVPLERHTEWIKMVADGIVDRLTSSNGLADYITGRPLPALATGQIVPPRALNGGSMFTDADIDRLVSGITAAFSANRESDNQPIKLYLDGRQIAETVTKHQRQMNYGRGV